MLGGLVPWHPEAGGGQIIAFKISEALAGRGHEVHHLAIAGGQYQREVAWGHVTFAPHGLGLFAPIRWAIRWGINGPRDAYDIVHVHTASETLGYCLRHALARRAGASRKFVMSIYAPKAYAPPRSVGELLTAISSHTADLIFCLSEFSKRDISRAYRVSDAKIAVTYAGVDSSFACSNHSASRDAEDPFVLLYCGRVNGPREQKGIDVLLHSLPMILRHHDVLVNIVGTGGRLEYYRQLAAELSVRDNVNFVGFVEHQHMPSQYARADLFVLPSRRESFGLVLAEAMACGLPVVSTTTGAIPEVIDDGVTGLLVPPEDPHALADAINSLVSDPEQRRAMGIAGRQRVEKYFTWDKVAERVLEGYYSIL